MAGWKDKVASCEFEGLLGMVQWEKTHGSEDTGIPIPFVHFLGYASSSLLVEHEAGKATKLWDENS